MNHRVDTNDHIQFLVHNVLQACTKGEISSATTTSVITATCQVNLSYPVSFLLSFSSTCSGRTLLRISDTGIYAGRMPPNRVKALTNTQNTDARQWPGLVLPSSTTSLLMEDTLFPLLRLSATTSVSNTISHYPREPGSAGYSVSCLHLSGRKF